MRNALLTGGSAGIGLTLCRQLLADGYTVINLSRRPAPLEHDRLHNYTVDLADPGCAGPQDDSEEDPEQPPACADGVDNDEDGFIDLVDPGCFGNPFSDSEEGIPACSDGEDNDGDGLIDYGEDLGCGSPNEGSEVDSPPECSDGIDNDGDGLADYPEDPGCGSGTDAYEFPDLQCQDGIDNDGDGAADYPDDFSCSSPTDDDETNPKAQCQDGIDNDGDGRFNEDDVGGINVNRSYPFEWDPAQGGSGPYPLAVPEALAVVDFFAEHPNITGAYSIHGGGWAVNWVVRPPANVPDDELPEFDVDVMNMIGGKYGSITGGEQVVSLWGDTIMKRKPGP